MYWGVKERFPFLPASVSCGAWTRLSLEQVSPFSIELRKGSLKSETVFFFFFLQRIFPPRVNKVRQPFSPKMSGLGFALSLTLLVRLLWKAPCECFWLWLLPVVWGRTPKRMDSWQKMWWALEHVFERRWDVKLWEVLWSSLLRHWDYLCILKKMKTKLLKVMAFLFTASVHTFF